MQNKTTGAGPVTIYRPNEHGDLVQAELLPAPTLETLADRLYAKRGPKPGQKVADKSLRGKSGTPGTFPSEW